MCNCYSTEHVCFAGSVFDYMYIYVSVLTAQLYSIYAAVGL